MSIEVFISHIHDEKPIADIFNNAIKTEFSGFVNVYQSSRRESNPAGCNWFEGIQQSLQKCDAALVFISPKSIDRPWINFELGALWIRNLLQSCDNPKKLPIIPICHSGLKKESLPEPISRLNAKYADDENELKDIFSSLQTAFGTDGVELSTDFAKLTDQIRTRFGLPSLLADFLSVLSEEYDGVAGDLKDKFTGGHEIYVTTFALPDGLISRLDDILEAGLHEVVEKINGQRSFSPFKNGGDNGSEITITFNCARILEENLI